MGMLLKIGVVVLASILALSSSAMAAITLEWTYPADGGPAPSTATGFKVHRATKTCPSALGSDFSVIATLPTVAVRVYVDNAIPTGTLAVCYYVTAYNAAGTSPESNKVQKVGPAKMVKPNFQ